MSEKLSDLAYKAIRNDIVHCKLSPAQHVTQSQLMERYAFGIVPVREALQRLAQDKLVEAVPRSGYIIRPITLSDVHEIYELRLPLEITSARLAAARASDDSLDKIIQDSFFTYDFNQPESYSEYLKRNAAFHIGIAVAASNQRLIGLISRLMDDLTRVLYLGLGVKDRGDEMQSEHIALAQAIKKRRPEEIEKMIAKQIEHSLQTILESLAKPSSAHFPILSSSHLFISTRVKDEESA